MHFTKPEECLGRLSLKDGAMVADIGAGVGFYTLPLAKVLKKLGDEGRVYAVDVQQSILSRLKAHAEEENLYNVETLWGDADVAGGTKLADGACDAIVIANILFQSEDKSAFATEMARILKRGGQALVIDWSESFGNLGPIPEAIVTLEAAKGAFESAGFKSLEESKTGEHHWLLLLEKK
jgi:ubiquinone/menaquinone biosynthesis C-methylase UbiE